MIGLIMAGGKGTRMKTDCEKLLLRYKKPVVLHVADALAESGCFERVVAVTSPNSPQTQRLLVNSGIHTIESAGTGYSRDLSHILQGLDGPVLVASGDMPLLDSQIIQRVAGMYDGSTWTSILVTKKFLDSLGAESDASVTFGGHECRYSGISLVNAADISSSENIGENYIVIDDKRLALNLNTEKDLALLGVS